MKKIAALVGAGALVLALVVPAMATILPVPLPSNGVTISNGAGVNTNVYTTANTGYNGISGMCVWGGKITTGRANSGSLVQVGVNTNKVKDGCNICGGDVKVSNWATVNTTVSTSANTGYNSIGGGRVGGGSISTGNANAGSEAYVVVNSNLVRE